MFPVFSIPSKPVILKKEYNVVGNEVTVEDLIVGKMYFLLVMVHNGNTLNKEIIIVIINGDTTTNLYSSSIMELDATGGLSVDAFGYNLNSYGYLGKVKPGEKAIIHVVIPGWKNLLDAGWKGIHPHFVIFTLWTSHGNNFGIAETRYGNTSALTNNSKFKLTIKGLNGYLDHIFVRLYEVRG